MTSVVPRRYIWQPCLLWITGLAVAVLGGCKPVVEDQPPPATATADNSPEKGVDWVEEDVRVEEDVSAKEDPADDPPAEPLPAIERTGQAEIPAVVWMPEPVEVADAEAADESGMKPYTDKITGTDVTFEMVPIPGGKFTMGSPEAEADRKAHEGPQHEVTVEPFWMGKCEVTWLEYELWGLGLDRQRREMEKRESTDRDKVVDAVTRPTKPYSDMTFGMGKDDYPAICMTQLAAKLYCKWLSAKTGRYYRLPTEAEWEYACRAGTATAYSFGDDPEQLEDYAWFFDNADDKYHKVGKKKPNPWGLHDMHGNVAEWVLDQLLPNYSAKGSNPAASPLAEPTKLYPRVVRGGSWIDDPPILRSAARVGSTEDWKKQDPQIPQSIWYHTDADFVGFRVVRPLRPPTLEQAERYDVDVVQIIEMRDYRESQAGKE